MIELKDASSIDKQNILLDKHPPLVSLSALSGGAKHQQTPWDFLYDSIGRGSRCWILARVHRTSGTIVTIRQHTSFAGRSYTGSHILAGWW